MNIKIESAFGFDLESEGGEHTVFVDDVDNKKTKDANKLCMFAACIYIRGIKIYMV